MPQRQTDRSQRPVYRVKLVASVAWQRGREDALVVVIANFSDYATPNPPDPASEYRVGNWPDTPPGTRWHEVAQDREVPAEWAGRAPLYPWEAKVYALV